MAKIWANGLVMLIAATLSLRRRAGRAGRADRGLDGPVSPGGGYLFSITSLGIVLATVARSMPQFGLLAIPVFLILNMLSGAITPLESMPNAAGPAAGLVDGPLRKFAQAVLYRAAGIDVVWPQIAILALIGAQITLSLARARPLQDDAGEGASVKF